jgi:hypothetical protein
MRRLFHREEIYDGSSARNKTKKSNQPGGLMSTTNGVYGPYVHKLNKGGLHEILTTQKFRATPARGSDIPGVRAHVGSFEKVKKKMNWSGRQDTYIEFTTEIPPCSGLPPWLAEWRENELLVGQLPIRVLGVVNGEGEPVMIG